MTTSEKITGKGGSRVGSLVDFFFFLIDVVFAVVLGAAADSLEGVEAGRRGGIGVDVNHLAALDVLEKPHRSVARVVLHHFLVVLTLAHVECWVLEDASLSVGALGWVLQEVLTD